MREWRTWTVASAPSSSEATGRPTTAERPTTTARRPAILVELGYSTNPQDGRFLTQRSSQRAMAAALADAIVDYLRDYERKVGAAGAGAEASR